MEIQRAAEALSITIHDHLVICRKGRARMSASGQSGLLHVITECPPRVQAV
jgi:hypothetical protein